MKIIILGAGQVGTSMAEILAGEANDVSLVDLDGERLAGLQDRLDVRTVRGSGAYPAVLQQAGADDADLLLAVTNRDEINMVACHVAHTLFDTPKKMARIRSVEYLNHRDQLFSKDVEGRPLGMAIDVIISPEEILTRQILRLIEHPGALQVVDFAEGKVQLVGIKTSSGGPLVGHELSTLRHHIPGIDARVAAIYREGQPIIPEGNTVIEPDDDVFFIAAAEHIEAIMDEFRGPDRPGRRIILAGAGHIGLRLASTLESSDFHVKLIERNPARSQLVAEELNHTVVLCGDSSDEELMLQESIDSTEVFCALTNDDEDNIMSAMLAKRLGARRTMALINRSVYVDLMESSMLDIAISPSMATVGSLLTQIRRGDIVAVHSLRRGAAEAIEAVAHGDPKTSRVVGKQLKEINLPPDTTVGAIIRGSSVIIAHGNTVIEAEDHVILFVIDKRRITQIEKLFSVDVSFF